jgi:hypothetical protein
MWRSATTQKTRRNLKSQTSRKQKTIKHYEKQIYPFRISFNWISLEFK